MRPLPNEQNIGYFFVCLSVAERFKTGILNSTSLKGGGGGGSDTLESRQQRERNRAFTWTGRYVDGLISIDRSMGWSMCCWLIDRCSPSLEKAERERQICKGRRVLVFVGLFKAERAREIYMERARALASMVGRWVGSSVCLLSVVGYPLVAWSVDVQTEGNEASAGRKQSDRV